MTSIDRPWVPPGTPEPNRSPRELARRLLEEVNLSTVRPTRLLPTRLRRHSMCRHLGRERRRTTPVFGSRFHRLAVTGGKRGRRAADEGLAAAGVSSFGADFAAKHLFARTRPDDRLASKSQARCRARVPSRQVIRRRPSPLPVQSRPISSAFAPLFSLATAVGYSRIHSEFTTPGTSWAGDSWDWPWLWFATGVSPLRPDQPEVRKRSAHRGMSPLADAKTELRAQTVWLGLLGHHTPITASAVLHRLDSARGVTGAFGRIHSSHQG